MCQGDSLAQFKVVEAPKRVRNENCHQDASKWNIILNFVLLAVESQRLKFEQEHGQTDGQNGQKLSGGEDATGSTTLVPGVKNSRLQNGLEFGRAY